MARAESDIRIGREGGSVMDWIKARFPLDSMLKEHITEYYASKNLNLWYVFGVLSIVVLVIQLLTGIFLTMNYKPSAAEAFASVEYIMRDVPFGWLIRYMHSTGASAFFIVVYLHMFRAMLYGSYRKPRELVWIIGMLIFIVLMAEAFFGYLLPWGQMSYWGAQVIVSLFGAIPAIGDPLVDFIRGDYSISDITLNRFFALHVIALPLALIMLVAVHILALHEVGSNNPDGIEIKEKKGPDGVPLDGIAFHPFHTAKDLVAIVVFFAIFFGIVFFAPEMNGYFLEHANFEPADRLVTPEHIAPVWYFTPFYAILRAVPDKLFRSHPHGGCRGPASVPAVAGPIAGQVGALQGLDHPHHARPVCGVVHRARLPRPAAGDRSVHRAGQAVHVHLFRVFPADAVLVKDRYDKAGSGEGGLPCIVGL